MVVVLVLGVGQQCHGANAQLAQLATGGQTCAHILHVDVPATCHGLAPEQGAVKVDEFAAATGKNGIDQVLGLVFLFGSPGWNAHVNVELVKRRPRAYVQHGEMPDH